MVSHLKRRSYSMYLLRILLISTLVILIAHLVLQYLNLIIYDQQNGFIYELSNRFDMDDESSIATWFSQAIFIAISAGAALAAYLSSVTAVRRLWKSIAVLSLLLSIDEVTAMHELILQSLHNIFFKDTSSTINGNAWLLVAPFVFAGALWLLWKIAKLLPRRTLILFSGAIFTFLVGAVFVDMLASLVERETFINQGIIIAIEETLELLGSVLVLYAIADYIEDNHGARLKSALTHLK